MTYKIMYAEFPSFLKAMSSYNKKNKDNPLFVEKRRLVIWALQTSPRSNQFKPHQLHGKMKDYWSMDTGLNSNADRLIFYIDDVQKLIYLYDIGNHSMYEAFLGIVSFKLLLSNFIVK